MKFSLRRKINLKARIADNPQYEMVDFEVIEAETPKEAEEAMAIWIETYIKELKEKFNQNKTPEQRFEDSL